MDIHSNVLPMVIQLPRNKHSQYNHKKKCAVGGGGEGRAGGTVPFYFKQSFSSAMSEFCISQSKILEMSIFS